MLYATKMEDVDRLKSITKRLNEICLNNFQMFDDKIMKRIATRIDPEFYSIELDGADKGKKDFLRILKIILNDLIGTAFGLEQQVIKKAGGIAQQINIGNENMEDYQKRVVEEKKELDEKIQKLKDFMHPTDTTKLDEVNYGLLMVQLAAMESYTDALSRRIELF